MILVEKYAENYDSRGVTGNNIISYQHNKTTIKLVKNYTVIVAAVFNKRIKKKTKKVMSMAITMKVTITQCINEQGHDTNKIQQHWKHQR